jgi:hypothetical protein
MKTTSTAWLVIDNAGRPAGIRPDLSDADLLPMGWSYRKTTDDEAWREIARANQPGEIL